MHLLVPQVLEFPRCCLKSGRIIKQTCNSSCIKSPRRLRVWDLLFQGDEWIGETRAGLARFLLVTLDSLLIFTEYDESPFLFNR